MRPRSLLLGVLLLAGCGRPEPGVRLLLDGEHAPDVLTEQRRIAQPPSLGGNRFLEGWWPWIYEGQLALSQQAPDRRVRLEVTHLSGGPRRLTLDVIRPMPGRSVRVHAAGRDLGSVPLTDPVEVTLPADLPLGRIPVDLDFDW